MNDITYSSNVGVFDRSDLLFNFNKVLHNYHKQGVIILKDFLKHFDLKELLTEINDIQVEAEENITQNWQGKKVCFYSKNPSQFNTTEVEYVSEPYFYSSDIKSHVFYEINKNNKRVVNRIGHGMHLIPKNKKIQKLVYDNSILIRILSGIGFKRPICHLSVYIPKHSNGSGSKVRPHQESTFANTKPTSVTVLWIALEDAHVSNGCMYGILGSNHWPLKWLSNVDHSSKKRTFKQINDLEIPDFLENNQYYTPLELKKGDALVFHGNFVHCSPSNKSSISRKALSFQFIETLHVQYTKSNWIQYPNERYIFNF